MKFPKEKTKEKRRQLKWEREVSFLTSGDRRKKKENSLTDGKIQCQESRKCKESFKETNNKTKNIFQIKIDTLITNETQLLPCLLSQIDIYCEKKVALVAVSLY